jgi:hypothetical protein
MNPVMFFAAVTFLGMVVALLLLFGKLGSRVSRLPVTAEWIEELSVERYRPMLHLLDGEDIELLRSQPGFTPAMAVKLRIQRSRVFRAYLRSLTMDFSRVGTALKIVMSQSALDRSDLASVLVHQQMLFACGLVSVHIRLFLYRWGVCKVDAGGLVKVFDAMRRELQSMVHVAEPHECVI